MRSACLVRTRFILNNFSGIGLGVPGPPPPWLCPWSVPSIDNSSGWFAAERSFIDCCTVRRAVLARLPTRQLARRAGGAQQRRRRSRRRRTKQVRAASLCQPAIEAADGFVYIYNVRT